MFRLLPLRLRPASLPATVHRRPIRSWGAVLLTVLGEGCVAYSPSPFDPIAALRELEGARLEKPTPEARPPGEGSPDTTLASRSIEGLTAAEAVAVALKQNPSIRAVRSEVGIAEALLVEAGLLSDVEVGWQAGEVIVERANGNAATTGSYVGGVFLGWEVPRPGEMGARKGAARAEVEGSRYAILAAEWVLARDVYLAHLRILASQARLDLNTDQLEIAQGSFDYFDRARTARAATALQASLARVVLENVRLERVSLEREEVEARQALNVFLGLPPWTRVPIAGPPVPFPAEFSRDVPNPADLAEEAMRNRPDLLELLASYRRAEEELRLEVAGQWPSLSIGTGIALELPIFRNWNRPAIRTALARRDSMRKVLEAEVHELRGAVYAAVAALERAVEEGRFFRREIDPRLGEVLRLTDQAFRERQVTPVEILAAQQQVLENQERFLEARIRYAETHLGVDAVAGTLLGDPAARKADRARIEESKETPR